MYVYRRFLIKRDNKYIKNYFYLKYKTFQPAFAGHHQLKYNQTKIKNQILTDDSLRTQVETSCILNKNNF